VVYLSLEGLVNAVKEGRAHDTLAQSSNHVTTNDCADVQLNGSSEDAVCNSDETTSRHDVSDTCKSSYCVGCLSGSYPIALEW